MGSPEWMLPWVILNFTSHVPLNLGILQEAWDFLGFCDVRKKSLFSGLSPNSCLFLRRHLPTKAGDHLRPTNHCPLLPLAFNSSVSPDRLPASHRDSPSALSLLEWLAHSVSMRQHVGVDTKQANRNTK